MAKVPFTSYNDANLTHTFPSTGTYRVEIDPVFGGVYFNGGGDKEKLTSFITLGDTIPEFLNNAFSGCSSMTYCNIDTVADMSHITSIASTWLGCSSLTNAPDISHLTNVNALENTWYGCSSLTTAPDVSAYTNATSLNRTWFGCSGLTVTPDVSNLTNVTDLSGSWLQCSSLTASPDVSSMTGVFDLSYTWYRCYSLKTISLPTDLSNVTTMSFMLNNVTLDTSDSGGFLGMDGVISHIWDEIQNGNINIANWTDISIDLGSGKYSSTVASKLADIVAEGFVVTTGGQL